MTTRSGSVTLGPTVADSSFDVVSSVDLQEVKNAIVVPGRLVNLVV